MKALASMGVSMLLAVAVGAAIGIWAVMPTGTDEQALTTALYDKAFPVIQASATVVTRTDTDMRVRMHSWKHRDCQLLEVQAYDVDSGGHVTRLLFERADGAQPSNMPPGKFRSAEYRIAPVPAHRLALSFMHSCQGRTVRTPITLEPSP